METESSGIRLARRFGGKEEVPEQIALESQDEVVLARFGKKQQLRRGFRAMSAVGLVCGLMLTWEGQAMGMVFGLQNGGPAGLIYGFIVCWTGVCLQALVMAEMASMIPLAGGPFNWVAVLAPPWCRKFLSYLTGWLTAMAWQSLVATTCYVAGLIVQALIVLNHESYNPQRWHVTLLFYAFMAFAVFVNTILARWLPRIESVMLIVHILGFIGVIIPLVYFAPHKTASEVFTTFENLGGFRSTGLAFFVGLLTPMGNLLGIDGADHIAEEIQDAPRVIPLSMVMTLAINGVSGLAFVIAMLFSMGDVVETVNTPTGVPFIAIFTYATGSTAGGTALTSIIIFAQGFSIIGIVATASRMLWAFAREKGTPGAAWLAKVDYATKLPLNSIMVTVLINALLALINIGSSAAFNAFGSMLVSSYYASFMVAGGIMLHKRLTTPANRIPWGPFRLGRAGVPVTIAALMWTFIGMFFSFWPTAATVDAESMNYSVLIFGGALIFSLVFWVIHGRKVYTGPIIELSLDGM